MINPNAPYAADDPIFRDFSANWKTCYGRGIRLWQELHQALRDLRTDACPNLQPTWSPVKEDHLFTLDMVGLCNEKFNGVFYRIDKTLDPVLVAGSGVSPICTDDGYELITWHTQKAAHGRLYKGFRYTNWFSVASRIIVASVNVGRVHAQDNSNKATGSSSTAVGESPTSWVEAPNRWAEVVFATWSDFCRRKGVPVSVLKFIARQHTWNQPAVDLVWEFMKPRVERQGKIPVSFDATFDNTSPWFYALLGTPNGVGGASMLTRYAGHFAGRDNQGKVDTLKTIGSVALNYDQSVSEPPAGGIIDMVFILDDEEIDSIPSLTVNEAATATSTSRGRRLNFSWLCGSLCKPPNE